ncbi:phage-related protein [Actinomadura coerulea]|uniref:Phage-related protein n=1 Tax=Actinomadura coerulea TaxID=46159 RepID=A0A7X0L3Q7_9ACTN|nr:hypothetical protein [Actinomadura coerulea]MBB6400519.1 phage-related protein [Actinomadura coerulea]GGQ07801.1 hypothetical protein GCM10010187_24860 [Actinomadura coerulea]
MALLSNLIVRIGANADGVRRGVNRANRELRRMRDQADRIGRQMGRSGSDGGREFGENFWRDANGRLHDARGRFVRAGGGLGDDAGRGFMGGFGRILRKMFGKLPDVMRAAAPIAAVGSALITAIPLLLSAGPAVASFVSAVLAASPALLGMAAAGFIVKKSFAAIFAEGSAARKALAGLGEMFNKAAEAGSRAAARGVAPLVAQLRKVAQPIVTRYMEGLGRAANRVQTDFLRWAKTADGLRTLRGILGPISSSLEGLAPHVSKLAISFVRMLGRIMGVSTALGSRGLAGALDWLSSKMDAVNAGTVEGGLAQLWVTAVKVSNAIQVVSGWIGKLVQAYKMYTTQFGLVADALSVVAMVFGGPIVTAIAAAGLIIRHFDQVKAGWEKLKAAFQGDGSGGPIGRALQDLKAAGAIVLPALMTMFQQVKNVVWPVLQDIGSMIKNDLIPTFAELLRAAAPFVAWLIGVLGPVVARTFQSIAEIVKGALNIIIGVMKVAIAIFSGDWSKAWEGIKQICRGAGQIVLAVFKWLGSALVAIWRLHLGYLSKIWGQIKSTATQGARGAVDGTANAFRAGVGKVRGAVSAIKNAVVGFFRGAASWLVGAGRDVVRGLVNGITGMAGWAADAARRLASNAINAAKGALGIHSPSRVFAQIGKFVGHGFVQGLTGTESKIQSTVTRMAKLIASAFKGRATRTDDRLIKRLQAANVKLRGLARERASIAAKMKAAAQMAAEVSQQAREFASVSAVSSAADGKPMDAGRLAGMLNTRLAVLRRFQASIKTLAKRGLSKDLLGQVIGMGPEQGAALADALSRSSAGSLKGLNKVNSEILRTSKSLGLTSADAMYDSGKRAGQGFLTGLKAQQGAILKMMTAIARQAASAVRKALGIHSPSRVMAELGTMTMAGFAEGVKTFTPAVQGAVRAATDVGDIAVPRGVTSAGAGGGAAATIVLKSGGSQLDDALVEILRKAINDRGGDVQTVLGR